MTTTDIIDQYHEHIPGILDRRLTLLKDSVKIVGNVRGVRSENTIMLAGLQPVPNKIWIRTKHFHWASALLFILSPFLFLPFVVVPPNFVLLTIGVVFYLPAIWYYVQSRKHKEAVSFMNRSGVVGFDFWCSGPDAERFSQFVAAITKQISEQVTL